MIFDKLFSMLGFERKESRTYGALIGLGLSDVAVWTPRDYEYLAKQSYQFNSDVYACVSLIAGSAKHIPWIQRDRQSDRDISDKVGPLELLKRPNERDSGPDFIEACIAYLLLSGNTYVERSGGTENKPPAFLYPMRPDRVQVIKGNRRNLISGYEYKAAGAPVKFEPWEVLHLRLFNPLNDYYGMSPLESALFTVDCANESKSLYKKLLQRGYPPGAVSVKGPDWTDEQIRDFKAGLRRANSQNEVLYLGNAEWQQMGFAPVDASLFEGRKMEKRDIASVFKVPGEMIGDTQSKTYANFREARRSLYTEAVIPAIEQLRDGFNSWIAPLYGENIYLDIDRDQIDALQEDREVAGKRVHLLWTSDLITRNEGRAELKYEAVPEDEDGYYSELVKQAGVEADRTQPEDEETVLPTVGISNGRPNNRDNLANGTGRRNSGSEDRVSVRRSNNDWHDYKALNLISEEEKDNHWKAVESTRERWYARIAADAEERFNAERDAVLKAFRDGGEASAIRAVVKQEDAWLKLYRSTYLTVSEYFARRTLQSFKSDGYEREAKAEQDLFTRTVLAWLAENGAERVVGILDTTKEKIRRELKAGVVAGEGIFELSKRLQSMYEQFSLVRAERISRTEVLSASSLGSQVAARSTNLPLDKEWVATYDSRTRDAHAVAHGQRRKIDQPYSVMGQSLMFPGDGSLGASGDNLIQCRCAEIYSIQRG